MEGQEIGRPQKGRAKYEVIIILIVVLAAIMVSVGISRARSRVYKGQTLIYELEQIRSAVTTYVLLNKSNPTDLVSLAKMTYSFEPGGTQRRYLQNVTIGKNGELIDPFGNPYKYDSETGMVSCTTKGFD